MAGAPAMQGFDPAKPTEIKVDFSANPVNVASWRVNDYGLVAIVATPADGGTDIYFVPWSRLSYAKQHTAPAPVVP